MLSKRNTVRRPCKVSNPILARAPIVPEARVRRFAGVAFIIAMILGWPNHLYGDLGSVDASENPARSDVANAGPRSTVDSPENTTDRSKQTNDPASGSAGATDAARHDSQEPGNGSNEGDAPTSQDVSAQFDILLTRIRHPPSRKLESAMRDCDALLALCRANPGLADRLSEEERNSIGDIYAWVAGLMMKGKYAPTPDGASEIGEIYNEEILRLFDCAIEIRPSYWKFYFGRACVREQFGDLGGALRDLDSAEKCDGPINRVCYAQGVFRARLSMLTDAIADLERAVAVNEEGSVCLWITRGEALLLLGNAKRAIVDLEKAAEAMRDQEENRVKIRTAFLRAEAYRLLDRMQEFETAYNEATEMFRCSPDRGVTMIRLIVKKPIPRGFRAERRAGIIVGKATYYFNLGMFDECLSLYEDLSSAECESLCDVQRQLGVIHLIRGQPEKAVKCFSRAIDIAGEDATAKDYFGCSEAWRRVGNMTKAIANYEQGRRLLFDTEPPEVTPFTGPYFMAYLERHGGRSERTDERPRAFD